MTYQLIQKNIRISKRILPCRVSTGIVRTNMEQRPKAVIKPITFTYLVLHGIFSFKEKARKVKWIQ
jgi:hypothetical protein